MEELTWEALCNSPLWKVLLLPYLQERRDKIEREMVNCTDVHQTARHLGALNEVLTLMSQNETWQHELALKEKRRLDIENKDKEIGNGRGSRTGRLPGW